MRPLAYWVSQWLMVAQQGCSEVAKGSPNFHCSLVGLKVTDVHPIEKKMESQVLGWSCAKYLPR